MATVELAGEVIIKSGSPPLMKIEAEKMVKGRSIGEATGLFVVPRLLDFDEAKGRLTMERVPELVGMRRAPMTCSELVDFARAVGRSLASIHAMLELPSGPLIGLDRPWTSPIRQCFIHGDVSTENVCYSSIFPAVPIFIDWQTTARHGGRATYDTGYFDVAWFLSNLFHLPFHRLNPELVLATARAFLRGYFERDDGAREGFRSYHRAFFLEKMNSRPSSLSMVKRAVLWRGASLWKQLVEEDFIGEASNV